MPLGGILIRNCDYKFQKYCKIGKFCNISNDLKIISKEPTSSNIMLYDLDLRTLENLKKAYPTYFTTNDIQNIMNEKYNEKKIVTIGNDVYIGDNVIIEKGINIGDGAYIKSNSVITNDIEPYSIVGGNPCKLLNYRFNQNQIDKLLNIKWWNWDEQKILKYIDLLYSNNIEQFLNNVE